MHYRKFDRQGQIMSKGGLTLAIKKEGDSLFIAQAQCGRKDNFNRKLGRTIAEGRLTRPGTCPIRILQLPPETSVKSFVHNQEFVRKQVKKLLAGGE